jgi:hypothetical protein
MMKKCGQCLRRKHLHVSTKAQPVPIQSSYAIEVVGVDYLSLDRSISRYAQVYPTGNQTAETTAKVLFENFVVNNGFQARIHSDQCQNLESHFITLVTGNHVTGTGMTERYSTCWGPLKIPTDIFSTSKHSKYVVKLHERLKTAYDKTRWAST